MKDNYLMAQYYIITLFLLIILSILRERYHNIFMNFLNFLTSKASLFNFNLINQSGNFQRENTILIEPKQDGQKNNAEVIKQETSNWQDLNTQNIPMDSKKNLAGQLTQLITQEQLLINQYMQLKLKYLESCLKINQDSIPQIISASQPQQNKVDVDNQIKQQQLRKKIKKQNKCGHDDKTHYAKGMCNNCYHKYGRNKKPWNCTHDKLYAAGMCQNCYINNYNRKRRQQKEGQKDGIDKIDDQSMIQENHENPQKQPTKYL